MLGHLGDRYTIRVTNHTSRRVEAVVSVDGRDVIDGKPGDFARKSGYLVPAWGQVEIDGWRLSQAQAAAFRFSSVADSYAARMGSARNVGVIGVAIFPERVYRPPPRPIYPAIPYRYDDEPRLHGYGRRASGNDALGAAPAPRAAHPRRRRWRTRRRQKTRPNVRLAKRMPRAARALAWAPSSARRVSSQIREVEFVRANPSEPAALLGLRYNDRAGLIAMGIDVDGPWLLFGRFQLTSHRRPIPGVAHPLCPAPVGMAAVLIDGLGTWARRQSPVDCRLAHDR